MRVVSVECNKCNFAVGFEYPNTTFFYCPKHKFGVNVASEQFATPQLCRPCNTPMQRYDLDDEDNVCPICSNIMDVTYNPQSS